MRVIKYSRVSTTDQADHGVSLAAQDAKLDAYANLYDLEIVASFEDAGESAKSLNRPGIRRALEMLRRGEAEGILISRLDRLTRNLRDWLYLTETFFSERGGRQLFSVGDSIDTRSAAGRLVLNMLLSVAQWEREAVGERTKSAMQHKKRCGERVTRSVYGMDVGYDGKMMIVNSQERDTIERMKQWRSRGFTYREIADELTALDVPTKHGKRWNHGTVRRILGNAT